MLNPIFSALARASSVVPTFEHSSLNDKNISLSVLKLASYVNNIQEASYTNIGVATDYDELVQLAFEYGILTEDENHNIQGESQLIDFIFIEFFSSRDFYTSLELIQEGNLEGKVLSLGAIANFLVFFVFCHDTATGIRATHDTF